MSVKITADVLDGIKARARAATPGPWFIEGGHNDYWIMGAKTGTQDGWSVGTKILDIDTYKPLPTRANADHIAGLDPQTVLAVVERLERAEALIAYIRPALPVLRTMCVVAGLDAGAAKADEMLAALAAGQPVSSDPEVANAES